MAATTDPGVAWALKALREPRRQSSYRIAADYYDGLHSLKFATEKFRSAFGGQLRAFADNLCPAVVDSISDRLKVLGVTSETDQAAADAAWAIWQRNRMDVRAPETHHEALLTGDGYALVWPNSRNEAVIWSLPASQLAVSYDPNEPGVIRRAARVWQDDDDQRIHLDIYYPDRVERYASRTASNMNTLPASYSERSFEPYFGLIGQNPDLSADAIQTHDYGRVPVVHFPNRRYHCYGLSELENVIPLQDALNKAVCDMLVAMEFAAFRQRWATGIDDPSELGPDGQPIGQRWDYGVDRILADTNPDAKFGDFNAADLSQFVEVQENLRSEIARVSGTPLHYLFITRGDFPSGEAMKSAEARFTRKVENRQSAFGNQWEDLLALALQIEDAAKVDASVLSLVWESASPLALETGEPAPTAITAAA